MARLITSDSSLPVRLAAYLQERFPPAAYTVLVVLFAGSALLVSRHLASGQVGAALPVGPAAQVAVGVVIWLAFFHLRVMDEHKDFARDAVSHPDRLLSRGVVTLPLLFRLGALAVVLQVALAATLGARALLAWAAAFVFSLLMRYEFGVGAWLGRHIVLYAITHNPIVAALAVFAWAASGVGWDARYLWYVGAVSLGSLAFEVGRKTHLPQEELPGVDSYSSVHGRAGAGALLVAVTALATVCGTVILFVLVPQGGWRLVLGLATTWGAGFAVALLARPTVRAKAVEGGSTLFLLAMLLVIGVAAW